MACQWQVIPDKITFSISEKINKMAKYYEMDENDVILTMFTDSMELYPSCLRELREQYGEYMEKDAIRDYHVSLLEQKPNNKLS